MTKDFRNIGHVSPTTTETHPKAADSQRPNYMHISYVLLVIKYGAYVFLAGGIWLIAGMPGPFQEETSIIVGIAFIFTAAADWVAIRVIKGIYEK